MNDELINNISEILCEWNPLGEKAESTPGLESYKYEAMDILSTMKILKLPAEKAVSDVLSQAFKITLDQAQLKHYAARIEQLTNVQ